jgi:hypothetical protein
MNTGGTAIADEAERVLKRARHTGYRHDPVVNAKAETYEVDCAAFVALLLEAVAPEQLARISKSDDERYPRAFEVFDFLHGNLSPGWTRVASVAEVDRGDVMAWRTTKVVAGHDTGHVLIVAQRPTYDAASKTWTVHVYDSSSIAHHDDSRERGGNFHPGPGSGAIKLRADAHGAPIAYQLGPHADFHTVPIVVARLHETTSAESRKTAGDAKPERQSGADSPTSTAPPAASAGHRIERAPVAGEVLGRGEYAITTYVLASSDAMLLAPSVVGYWGPGQAIPPTLGRGSAAYALAGGVVFRNG